MKIKRLLQNNANSGEASIVFVFVILMIVIMSALTISVISISTIKGSKSVEDSALALYAADTGLERATYDYWWGAAVDAENDVRCESNGRVYISAIDGSWTYSNQFEYEILVNNGVESVPVTSYDNCPVATEVVNNTDELCIEAIGRHRDTAGKFTERKLSSASGLDGGAACVDVFK